jgi:hypothetical protein
LTLERPKKIQGKMAAFTPKLQFLKKSVKPFDGFKKPPAI